jgi:SAM-dependent methyltransferase
MSAASYEQIHAERFARSLEWLRPALAGLAQDKRPLRVLEAGERGPFTSRLRAEYPASDLEIENTSADLRHVFYPTKAPFDAALCMEVLEHIADRNRPMASEWSGDGARSLLEHLARYLRPGGLLFLTTPNACSVNVLRKLLTMRAPMMYRPHIREYAPSEVVSLVEAAGFVIERFETLDVWHDLGTAGDRQRMARLLADYPSPHRGEDIFILARRKS